MERRDRGPTAWIPPGRHVEIAGCRIPGGSIYVGQGLPPVHPGRRARDVEPALIDPSQPVDWRHPDMPGSSMIYWSSYAGISPQARAGYLSWLGAGRPGGAYVSYVLLWFYGIERRLLLDARTDPRVAVEIPLLVAEVERLLDSYAHEVSFRRHATDFLGAARLIQGVDDPGRLAEPHAWTGRDLPVDVQVRLARLVADDKPIPADWAFAWVLSRPEVRLRAPATRCRNELAHLFAARYERRYGDGITVRANKPRLRVVYRPASPSFVGDVELDVGDLPDVTRLSAPLRKLLPILEQAIDDLDAYSRYVGRGGDRRSLAAQALLPPELTSADSPARQFVSDMTTRLQADGQAVLRVAELVELGPSVVSGRPTRKEVEAIADLLGRNGIGLEPDVRHGGVDLAMTNQVVAFRLPVPVTGTPGPSQAFITAAVLLSLVTTVAATEGRGLTNEQRLEAQLERFLHLDRSEQARLRAHLRWLLQERPSAVWLKRRVQALVRSQRHRLGRLLISVIGADGQVDRTQLDILAKIYPMLGLGRETLHADVHALASHRPASGSFPTSSGSRSGAVTLAHGEIAAIMADTAAVAAALGALFDGSDQPALAQVDAIGTVEAAERPATVAGLDPALATFVAQLVERPVWARAELEQLADRLGLLPAGSIETINNAAFDVCDEPLLDGDDPVEVNVRALAELLP